MQPDGDADCTTCRIRTRAILDVTLNVDPVAAGSVTLAPETTHAVSPDALSLANLAIRLGYALAHAGWFPHQHHANVATAEEGSLPFHGPLDPDTAQALARCQALVDELVETPPPRPTPDFVPWPRNSDGTYRLIWSSHHRPAESSFTTTSSMLPTKRLVIWKTIVTEIASSWACADRRGRSSGRVFLGPKDRFLFWPKELNLALDHRPATFGRLIDLFSTLAIAGVKVDIKSAYRAIELGAEDASYHAAVVDGYWLTFLRLSFGMAQSPVIFSTALATTIGRFQGSLPATAAALTQWVDDSGLAGCTLAATVLAAEGLLTAFRRDGWWAATKKCFLWPATRLLYTGFILDFPGRSVLVNPAKAAKCRALLSSIRRPTDSAIAVADPSHATNADPALTPDPDHHLDPSAHRCSLLTSLCSRPGIHVACLGPLVPTDAPPRPLRLLRNVAVERPPPPFTVTADTPFNSLTQAVTELPRCAAAAAAAGQPLLVVTGTADASPLTSAAVPTGASVVVVTAPPAPTDSTPLRWWSPDLRIPQRLASDRIDPTALPGNPADVTLPDQTGDRTTLEPAEWHALRSAVGMLSWWQVALAFIAPWRAMLQLLVTAAQWTAVTAAAFDAVYALTHVIEGWSCSVDPPSRTLHIVTDASSTGWGATIIGTDGNPVYLCGTLTPAEALASSGYREAAAAVAAIRAAMADPRVPPFDGVSVTVDSTVLCGASAGRPGPGVAIVLCTLAAWAVQGLQVRFEWQRRDSVSHRAPDALSSAASARAPWPLRDDVLGDILHDTGPAAIDLTAYRGHDPRTAPAYATPALDAPADRRRVLLALAPAAPAATDRAARHGWVGVSGDVTPRPGEAFFAHPLWGDIRLVADWHSAHPGTPLIVVAPSATAATRRQWWGAHLERLCDAALWSATLPCDATVPPTPGTPRDPRPMRVYVLGGTPADARAFNGSSRLGSPARLAWVRGGRNPGDGPGAAATDAARAERRRRLAAALRGDSTPSAVLPSAPRPPPAPRQGRQPAAATAAAAGHPGDSTRRARLGIALGIRPREPSAHPEPDARPRHQPLADGRADTTSRRDTAAPQPKTRRVATSAASRAVAAAAKAPTVAPPAVATLGGWLLALRDFIASRNAGVADDTVPSALQPFLAVARATIRLKAVAGSRRTVRAPRYLFQLVVALGIGDAPFNPATVDATAVTFAIRRLDPEPPFGWRVVEAAATVKSDLSAVSAMSGRMGVAVAPVCGAIAAQYLNARGAGDRAEHSHAWPIHVSDLLKVEPPHGSPKWSLWAACVVLAFFCLRPGVLRHLHRLMFVAWRGGWILIWRYVSKTTTGDILDPELRSAVERVAAARNPVLTRVFERLPRKGPLFPDATVANLDTLIKESYPRAPKGFRLCTYGIRVAADLEAVELGVPTDLTNALFWWRRLTVSSRLYYGGLSIHRMYLFSEARTRLSFVHFFAGRYDARISGGPRPDFKEVPTGVLPPLPAATAVELDAAWAAEVSSVADERVGRALKVSHPQAWQALPADAPPAEAEAKWPAGDDEASDTMSVDCGGCGSHLDRNTPGTACSTRTCKYVLGECCHRRSCVGILCPAHDPSAASKASGTKVGRRNKGRK